MAFSPDALLDNWKLCAASVAELPVVPFLAGCDEVKKIIGTLGSAFGIASADIVEKSEIVTKRNGELKAFLANRAPHVAKTPALARLREGGDSLQMLVEWEMLRGVERQDSGAYVSGARSLLRLMWFLDFLYCLLTSLVNDADNREMKAIGQDAYDTALAKHHPWILRKTIGAAFHFLPSKANFMKNLAMAATPHGAPCIDVDAVLKPKLRETLEAMAPVRAELWRFYGAHKITDLP